MADVKAIQVLSHEALCGGCGSKSWSGAGCRMRGLFRTDLARGRTKSVARVRMTRVKRRRGGGLKVRDAVHHAEAMESPGGTVIHVDGEPHMNRTFGVNQEIYDPFLDPIDPGQGPFELLGSINEKVETLGGFGRHIHHSPRRIWRVLDGIFALFFRRRAT